MLWPASFLDEIYREMARLGTDVNATLTQPLTKLVMQMPQFRSTDGFYSFDMSRHFLFYSLAQPAVRWKRPAPFWRRCSAHGRIT